MKSSLRFPRDMVPKTLAAFPRCIAKLSLCARYAPALRSPEARTIRVERSCKNFFVSDDHGPIVSTASAANSYCDIRDEYLRRLSNWASSAAAPALREVLLMWDGAKVSVHVESHTRVRPRVHRTKVAPSGLLTSSLTMPHGFKEPGIFAVARALRIMSLRVSCR